MPPEAGRLEHLRRFKRQGKSELFRISLCYLFMHIGMDRNIMRLVFSGNNQLWS